MSSLMTRRRFLVYKAIEGGADIFTAVEAVSSTALAHPEWDMDEQRTWASWHLTLHWNPDR